MIEFKEIEVEKDVIICENLFTIGKFIGLSIAMIMFFALLYFAAILDGGVL